MFERTGDGLRLDVLVGEDVAGVFGRGTVGVGAGVELDVATGEEVVGAAERGVGGVRACDGWDASGRACVCGVGVFGSVWVSIWEGEGEGRFSKLVMD